MFDMSFKKRTVYNILEEVDYILRSHFTVIAALLLIVDFSLIIYVIESWFLLSKIAQCFLQDRMIHFEALDIDFEIHTGNSTDLNHNNPKTKHSSTTTNKIMRFILLHSKPGWLHFEQVMLSFIGVFWQHVF